MTYVVTDACIKCKYMDCVEVCPVDCFYEGENMLVIHPDECIDCGVCEPECPADAIKPDTEPGLEKWLEVNTEYAKSWPNITQKKEQPADAKDFDGMEGKFEKYFSNLPSSPLCSSASGGLSFLRVMFGHCAEKLVFTSSHFSSPLSVSGRIASAGHSGSHTPQSMHSLGLMTSMFSPS